MLLILDINKSSTKKKFKNKNKIKKLSSKSNKKELSCLNMDKELFYNNFVFKRKARSN